jgi:hypothetical protein
MGLQDVPRCQHVKVNGVQCGSPALKRRRKCYFHERLRLDREKFQSDQFATSQFELAPLEDANAVQVGLMKVIQWLASGRMDPKVAGLILFALQTASCNLKNTNFDAVKPTDVVIDPKDVDRTCINGPQWFEKDFEAHQKEAEQPQEEKEKTETETETETEKEAETETEPGYIMAASQQKATQARPRKFPPAPVPGAPCETCRARALAAKPRSYRTKMERELETEEESTIARDFFYKLMPEIASEIEKNMESANPA